MKKSLFSIIFTLLLTTVNLGALAQSTAHAAVQNSDEIEELVNKQLEAVEERHFYGYEFSEARPVKLTRGDIPEIAVFSFGYDNGEHGIYSVNKSMLQIYQYNTTTKSWEIETSP